MRLSDILTRPAEAGQLRSPMALPGTIRGGRLVVTGQEENGPGDREYGAWVNRSPSCVILLEMRAPRSVR